MYGVILAGCCPREYRQQAAGVRVEAFDRFERTTPGLGTAAVLGPGDFGPGAAFSGRGPQRGRCCEPEGGVYLGVGEDPLGRSAAEGSAPDLVRRWLSPFSSAKAMSCSASA